MTPIQARILLSLLDVAPDALEETQQFTSKEIAAWNLARSLKAEGRYADAIKVLFQRGMVNRLGELTNSLLKVGNKATLNFLLGDSESIPFAKSNSNRTLVWTVAWGKRKKDFYGSKQHLDFIYRTQVVPFLRELELDGVNLDEVVVVDVYDMEEHLR